MIEGGLHGNIKGYREEPLQRAQPEDKKLYVMFIDSKRNQIKIHLKQKHPMDNVAMGHTFPSCAYGCSYSSVSLTTSFCSVPLGPKSPHNDV